MNTRKYPRTMNEAFGPYSNGPIHEPSRPMDWQDRVVLTAAVIAAICVIAIMVLL
jgi:hypothetical protein